jgi:hypothetical protein
MAAFINTHRLDSTSGLKRPGRIANDPQSILEELNRIKIASLSPEELGRFQDFRRSLLLDVESTQRAPGTAIPSAPAETQEGRSPRGSSPASPSGPTEPPAFSGDPIPILRAQDPEAYIAFTALGPEQKQAFIELCRRAGVQQNRPATGETPPPLPGQAPGGMLGGLGGAIPGILGGAKPCPAPAQPQINPDLLELLKSGKLLQEDSTGGTLLDTLTNLSTQKMGEGLDRQTVFNDLCSQLADPGRMKQGGRGTCTVATMQNLQASRDPAEYARLVTGLSAEEGRVRMKNGDILEREEGTLTDDGSRRDSVSRLYQAALMEYANGNQDYSNVTDRHTNPDGTDGGGGLGRDEQGRALDALFGDKYDPVAVDARRPGAREQAVAQIQSALARGEQIPVALTFGQDDEGQPTGHALLLVGMTDTTVILRNPWGSSEQGQDQLGRPSREALDNEGHIEMSIVDFFLRCHTMHLPKEG